MVIRESWILRQPLELRRSYEIVALLPSQNLEHLLGVRVQVQLVKLSVLYWQYFLQAAHFLHTFHLIIGRRYNFYRVRDKCSFDELVQLGQSLLNVTIR